MRPLVLSTILTALNCYPSMALALDDDRGIQTSTHSTISLVIPDGIEVTLEEVENAKWPKPHIVSSADHLGVASIAISGPGTRDANEFEVTKIDRAEIITVVVSPR